MNESRDLDKEVKRVAEKLNVDTVNVEWSLIFEHGLKLQTYNRLPVITETLEHKKYPKKYLNFNRRWRIHRPMMVSLLKAYDLLDKGYVSLGKSDDGNSWDTVWWDIKQESKIFCPEMYQTLIEKEQDIINMGDLYLDTPDLVTNRAWLDNDTDYLYNDTYFSLVSETNYFSDRRFDGGRFITEKTFKAITCEHPFILATLPNTLPLLHKLGYKTFDPWIDESYDSEIDDFKRMLMIAEEVKRLCNLPKDELTKFLLECKKITKWNVDLLLSKKNWIYKMNYK